MRKTLNRRETIRLLVVTPLMAAGLSACGKKSEPDSCSDVSALSDGEKSARSALQYTDKSPQADKHCDVCNFYQPAGDPAACGGCQLVKGPIHPKGYCTAFAAKT
ncbi:MAG TPA: high-potential iron-sulfur protein [Polyangiales bacterium]